MPMWDGSLTHCVTMIALFKRKTPGYETSYVILSKDIYAYVSVYVT